MWLRLYQPEGVRMLRLAAVVWRGRRRRQGCSSWHVCAASQVLMCCLLTPFPSFCTFPSRSSLQLTTTMKELGDLLSAEEIAAFVALMDHDKDGVVGVSTPAGRELHVVHNMVGRTMS